jgi:hypothetical protein
VRRFSRRHQRTCSSQQYNRSDPETVFITLDALRDHVRQLEDQADEVA